MKVSFFVYTQQEYTLLYTYNGIYFAPNSSLDKILNTKNISDYGCTY